MTEALAAAFVAGVAVGATVVVVLRHELPVSSRLDPIAGLAGLGVVVLGAIVTWARVLRRLPRGPGEARPWTVFLWASLTLVVVYLWLVTVVLFV